MKRMFEADFNMKQSTAKDFLASWAHKSIGCDPGGWKSVGNGTLSGIAQWTNRNAEGDIVLMQLEKGKVARWVGRILADDNGQADMPSSGLVQDEESDDFKSWEREMAEAKEAS